MFESEQENKQRAHKKWHSVASEPTTGDLTFFRTAWNAQTKPYITYPVAKTFHPETFPKVLPCTRTEELLIRLNKACKTVPQVLPHDLIINERESLHERSLLFSLLFDIASSSSLIKLTSEVSNVCFKGCGSERDVFVLVRWVARDCALLFAQTWLEATGMALDAGGNCWLKRENAKFCETFNHPVSLCWENIVRENSSACSRRPKWSLKPTLLFPARQTCCKLLGLADAKSVSDNWEKNNCSWFKSCQKKNSATSITAAPNWNNLKSL